jgi:hypothetical protein
MQGESNIKNIKKKPIAIFTVPVYSHFHLFVAFFLHVLILEGEDITLPPNIGIWLANDAVSYSRRIFDIWD